MFVRELFLLFFGVSFAWRPRPNGRARLRKMVHTLSVMVVVDFVCDCVCVEWWLHVFAAVGFVSVHPRVSERLCLLAHIRVPGVVYACGTNIVCVRVFCMRRVSYVLVCA